MVRIDVYVMVHNEEKMLPYFLRHYGSFAQHIYAFEDESTDRSWEILDAHPLVTIIQPEVHGINEKFWCETLWPLYEHFSREHADYVIQVDADEFVYHSEGVATILEEERKRGMQLLHCQGYTMIAEAMPSTDGQIYETLKYGLPDKLSSKWAVFDPAIHLRYTDGRHRIAETSSTNSNSRSGLRILHYRYLGRNYFEERDIRNRKRFDIVDEKEIPYSPTRKHNLPDGSRGIKLDWYAQHKDEARDVT